MTREEIENIPKIVNALLDLSVSTPTRQKLNERLNKVCELAIKELEKEYCEDCVSRQAVLDKAVYTETEEGWSGRTVDVKDIEALPSVTPAREHGRWIVTNEKDEIYAEICVCDKCNFAQIGGGDFCANCGAMMVEEE